jgi:hypothetical protein
MRLIVAAALVSLAGCRIFMAEEWSRRDRCAASMQIYREAPREQYRVIKVLEAKDENDLAWKACAEKADAVIAESSAGIEVNINIGRPRRERAVVRGVAIRYVRH